MPDMGLIAQRYTLDLMGASQQLQLRSWTSQIGTRFSKTIPFTWEADKWYTMKFQASTDGDESRAQGKGLAPRRDRAERLDHRSGRRTWATCAAVRDCSATPTTRRS